MCKEAARVPGNYFYVFPTKEDARRALWEKILDDGNKLLSYMPEGCRTRLSNQEMVMEVMVGPVQSTIRVVGLDKNPEAIRGITPQGVVFSEFAFSDPDAYRALIPALRRDGNFVIINSTPNGRNHFYNMYEGVKKNGDWFVSEYQAFWPEKENFIKVEEPEYFETLVGEGIMDWEDIEREFGCSFSTGMKGSFYVDQVEKARKDGRIGNYSHDDHRLVDTFWDIGSGDDAPVWFRQVDGNRIIFFDYCENAGRGVKDFVTMLADKGYDFRNHYLPHDADHKSVQTGTTTASLFEDMLAAFNVSGSVEVLPKTPNRQHGINAVRSRFSRYHFDEDRCHLGIKHLEGYTRKWDKHRKVFLKDPVHDQHSHSADALRYEAEAEDEGNWVSTPETIKVNTGLDFGDI